jgi:hypothetical protein
MRVDNARLLHYIRGGFAVVLHVVHSPYDDNGILEEVKDGVLGTPGKTGTTEKTRGKPWR